MALAHLTVLVSSLLAWSDVQIQPSRSDRATASYRSVAAMDRPTERTLETLKRYDLEREYRRDVNCLDAHREIRDSDGPRPSWSMHWPSSPGSRESGWTAGESRQRSTATSMPPPMPTTSCSIRTRSWPRGEGLRIPRYRLAMEIYNAGVDHLIHAAHDQRADPAAEGRVIPFKFHGREERLRIVLQNPRGKLPTSTRSCWLRISR